MSNQPPNSASRRPEGSWPPPDDDFRIVQPAGVSQPPPGVSSAPAPQQVVQPVPQPQPQQPRPVVVAPPPTPPRPQVAKKPQSPESRQRIIMGVVVALVLLSAVGFYLIAQILGGSANNGNGTPGPVVNTTVVPAAGAADVAETAIAANRWPTAGPACDGLNAEKPTDAAQKNRVAANLIACGQHFVDPASANVERAAAYFKNAAALAPNNATIKHQLELSDRYLRAKVTLNKPDLGGFIDQLEWFPAQPEFAAKPYADTAQLLYNAYVDSGKGSDCGNAVKRYKQALAVKFVDDKSVAEGLLAERLKECTP